MQPIGILGGTFDPIHNGHLRIALELYQALGLAQIRFIPSAQPPHRGQPQASAQQRIQMLELAIQGQAGFQMDLREQQREGMSYSVDTLTELRQELGETPVCFIVGSDAFEDLDTWHEWQRLFDLCHFIVAYRPGWVHAQSKMAKKLAERMISDPAQLQNQANGHILPWPVTQLAISATEIRKQIQQGKSPRYIVPEAVHHYIAEHRLYQTNTQ